MKSENVNLNEAGSFLGLSSLSFAQTCQTVNLNFVAFKPRNGWSGMFFQTHLLIIATLRYCLVMMNLVDHIIFA